jgi:ABC-type transport system substrate-binding protein
LDGVDPGDAARLAARYGPGSSAAQNGRQRFFVNKELTTRVIVLNTHRPLFHDVRLRRAINYAIDRRKLNELVGDMQSSDQYLPFDMPGFKDVDIYPFTPNVSAARRLAGAQRRTAIFYTGPCPVCAQFAQIVKLNLGAIGIDVVVKTHADAVSRIWRPGEPFDLAGPLSWGAGYPDPAQLLGLPGTGVLGYLPFFDDPSYKRKVTAASRLSGPRRYLAYGALDVDTARNAAPVVSLGNRLSRDFFSARLGCQVFNPVWGIDLAALCIKP